MITTSAGKSACGLPRQSHASEIYRSTRFVRERLDAFADAFLADRRPGLIFEYGRLVFANQAARNLADEGRDRFDAFVRALAAAVRSGGPPPAWRFECRLGAFAPVFHPERCRPDHPTRVCFLQRRSSPVALAGLSEREKDVLGLLVKGLTNAQIAAELGIALETVRKHVASALGKSGAHTRAGLVGKALAG